MLLTDAIKESLWYLSKYILKLLLFQTKDPLWNSQQNSSQKEQNQK